MRTRRYFAAKTQDENKIEFQLIASIYQNDEAAFDTLIGTLDSIDQPIGTGKSKWTSLMFAVHKKRTRIVDKLLTMGADPNCYDHSTKKSCLHTACTFGYGGIAQLLLQTGKINDINHNNNEEGESLIYISVKKSRKYCVQLLLNYALHSQICNINVRLKTNGQTPIWIACDKGDIEIIRLLLRYKHMKCDLNLMDTKGYSPIMKAVGKNHIEVVKLLLDKQFLNPLGVIANINLVNNWDQCATMIAVRTNNWKISKMLLNEDENHIDEDNDNHGVLYRTDYRDRTILDVCIKYRRDKRIVGYIKKLLHVNIHSVIKSINTSKDHQNVPYLPNGVVQYICNMTY
eukprot:UN02654